MTVHLHVWRIPAAAWPQALWRMAADRRRVRAVPGVRFAKLLGTGRGAGFGPARPDPARWAALTVSDGAAPPFPHWDRLAVAWCRLDLEPLSSRGAWAGRDPFPGTGTAPPGEAGTGPVLVLTRARLRPWRAVAFWHAIGPVGAAVRRAPGLLAAFGIGEAPLGWQGTVSLWRGHGDLLDFAYRQPEHLRVVRRTPTVRWYAEELFARFAVRQVSGDTTVIGWRRQ